MSWRCCTWTELDTFLASMLSTAGRVHPGHDGGYLLALSFGLVNTLAMAVFERVREIGLMQALGMRPGLILGPIAAGKPVSAVLGLLLGNLLAWLTIKPLEVGIDISGVAQGMEMMGMGTTLYPALACAGHADVHRGGDRAGPAGQPAAGLAGRPAGPGDGAE